MNANMLNSVTALKPVIVHHLHAIFMIAPASPPGRFPIGFVVGGGMGGLALVLVVVGAVFFVKSKAKRPAMLSRHSAGRPMKYETLAS